MQIASAGKDDDIETVFYDSLYQIPNTYKLSTSLQTKSPHPGLFLRCLVHLRI